MSDLARDRGGCHTGRMAMLRRRLLGLSARFGLHVTRVAPGAALVARRRGFRVRRLAGNSWLVSRGRPRQPQTLSGAAPKGSKAVPLTADATLLVRQKKVRQQLWDLQKEWYRFLTPEHVAWILEKYQVNCVIDVGANTGQYARSLRRAGFRGRIASFEPLPHIVEKLRRSAADDPDWLVFPYALGKEATSLPMNVVGGTMSSILPPNEYGSSRYKRFENVHTEDIEVRRLDDVLDEILAGIGAPRPYLKLDTQGYDVEAFAGLGARVREFVGMQSEVALVRIYEGMPRMPQAIETYEDAGFEVTGMFPVSREQSTGRVLEYDCVMVRPEALPADA